MSALAVTGGGTKAFYGNAPRGEAFDVRAVSGVVDYEPTELVVTGTQSAQVIVNGSSTSMAKRPMATPNSATNILPNNTWSYASQQDHFSVNGTDTWAEASRYHTTGGGVSNPFDNEIMMMKTDASYNVRRICHHRAVFSVYADAPFASTSFDNRFVIFSSNWGTGGGRYDVYITEVTQPSSVVMYI